MTAIWIDGASYEVREGQNVLEAILGLGLDLPYFCWHPALGSIGSCRQCAVLQFANAEDTRGRLVMGCMTPVAEGMRLSLNGEKPREFRKAVVEALMVNHPHDCPVCAEGGECHLQDMTVMTGHNYRRYRGLKNTHRNQHLGPFLHHEMNRCITCYRCVRFYRDYAGGTDLAALASRDRIYFGRHEDGVLESEFAGNLVEVCPTGVFTDRTLVQDYTRKWDLQSAPSICHACGLGCNILPGERYGRLKRVHNRYHDQVNGYFLCDRGRYGASWVNAEERFGFAGLRSADGSFRALGRDGALAQLAGWCAAGRRVIGIGSPRASLETNAMLRRLVGVGNFCDGVADTERAVLAAVRTALELSGVPGASLRQVEDADAVLILGEDVSNTAPRLALGLRQSVRNAAKATGARIGLAEWQDAAVRNLAQGIRSPLFAFTPAPTRLDDIAAACRTMAPTDIARFGFAVAAALGAAAAVDDLPEDLHELAAGIAETLCAAKRPLVVTGSGCQDAGIVQAAALVAQRLHAGNGAARLACCVAECNSLGAALLARDEDLGFAEIGMLARERRIDTLLVVENDLYRRADGAEIDLLFDTIAHVVVLDVIATPTTTRANLALPAASFLESEGTLVSSEGRAQRFFALMPAADERAPSWHWLAAAGHACGRPGFEGIEHFDAALYLLTTANELPAEVVAAAPAADWRGGADLKVARQPHRYSGRTAMRAAVSVHEPRQPADADSALAFSMEGLNASPGAPAALLPFVWAPGWNSNQSLHRFQAEVGGPLKGGSPGVRLIEPGAAEVLPASVPAAYHAQPGHWLLVPLHRVFGSDELSALSPAVAERAARETVMEMHPEDAAVLGITPGDGVAVDCPIACSGEFPVRVNPGIPRGCIGFPVGAPGAECLSGGRRVPLRRIAGLAASADAIIASDAGGA